MRPSELTLASAEEQAFVDASATHGFASAVVAPAPTCAGGSRVSVLCIGSTQPGYFEDDGYPKVRVLARALAMERHRWLLQAIRRELLIKSRLTAADIELLRYVAAGHTSKLIGAALNIEATGLLADDLVLVWLQVPHFGVGHLNRLHGNLRLVEERRVADALSPDLS